MQRRSACQALMPMNDHDKNIVDFATERFERRLAEENGKLRVDMATGFGAMRADMERGFGAIRVDMEHALGAIRTDMERGSGAIRADMERGYGELRSEMIHRNAELLKWALRFFVVQLAAMAGLLALFR